MIRHPCRGQLLSCTNSNYSEVNVQSWLINWYHVVPINFAHSHHHGWSEELECDLGLLIYMYSSAIRAMCHALLWIQVAPKSWMNHVTLNLRIPTNQACSSVPNHRGHLTTHPTIRNCTFAFRWVWWRHNMDTIFIPLALCEGNPSVTCGFPTQMGSCEELCY